MSKLKLAKPTLNKSNMSQNGKMIILFLVMAGQGVVKVEGKPTIQNEANI